MRYFNQITAALFALFVGSASADAWLIQGTAVPVATSQVFTGMSTGLLPGVVTRFISHAYAIGASSGAFSAGLFPVAGNVTSLIFNVVVNPSGATTWTATLQKNAVDTALTCTINSGSANFCTSTGSVSFSAGDAADVKIVPASSPTNTVASVSILFTPTAPNDSIITGRASSYSTSAANAGLPLNSTAANTLASRLQATVPDGGTIDKLYVSSSPPGTAGQNTKFYDWAIAKNGTAQTFTCNIAAAATSCNDTTNSFSVSGPSGSTAGDSVSFAATPSGTPSTATAAYTARYLPTTTGSFSMMMTFPTGDSNTFARYYPVTGGAGSGSTVESDSQSVSHAMTVTKIAATVSVAPTGVGKTRTFTLRVNGSNTALTCTISNADTACTGTGSVTVNDNDLLSTGDVPSGTPSGAVPAVSYLAHR